MNERRNPDPLDALRAANPVDDDRLSSASLARIRARVSEDVMASRPVSSASPRGRLAAAGIAAAALALALIVFQRPAAEPGVIPGGSVGPGSAACVDPYTGPSSVARRTFAFDGTVTAVEGDEVTFTVHAAYRGSAGGSVTLEAPGMTGTSITSAGGPNLSVDERYLVAGDDRFVWACGYTQPYDAAVAAEWAAAVGS